MPFPSRRTARAAGVVAAFALIAALVHVPPAAATPAPTQPVVPLERVDEAAAHVTARLTGQRVLISGKTTEYAQYYALPSGQTEAVVSAGPVRMRDAAGQWIDIDLTLVRQPDGSVAPKAQPGELKLTPATLGWSGLLPEPELYGSTATYREVKPGVDLVVEVTRTGYQQRLQAKPPGRRGCGRRTGRGSGGSTSGVRRSTRAWASGPGSRRSGGGGSCSGNRCPTS